MTALKKENDELLAEIMKLKADSMDEASAVEDCVPVSFWVPREYKKKFADLQDMTNKQFGKVLKKHFLRAIDAAIE